MRTRSTTPMHAAKIGYIIVSAALCVLGILLIAVPDFSASLFGAICGVLLIVFGIVRLIGYFSRDLYRLAFQYDLPLGILLVIMGIVMLAHPGSLVTFICVALGIFILSDGLFKIQIAWDSRRFGITKWWLILAFAIVTGICGLLLLLRPGEGGRVLMIILGITLLSEGILNFSTVLSAVKIIKHQKPDVIEIDAGDTYAYDTEGNKTKRERELKAADRIFGLLPDAQRMEYRGLWDEFEAMETVEAKFANMLDKVQPLLLNNASDGKSWVEHSVRESQVLARNSRTHEGSEELWAYAKSLIEENVKKGRLQP